MTLFTIQKDIDKLVVKKESKLMSWNDLETFFEMCADDSLTYDIEIHQASQDTLEISVNEEDLDSFIEHLKEHAAEDSIAFREDEDILIFEDKAN